MTWTWTIGILLCIAGAIITSLGMALQKYAHSLNAQRPAHEQRHYVWLPRWWAGFVCFVFGQLATVMSLGFGSEAVLSSLGSVALVSSLRCALFCARTRPLRVALLHAAHSHSNLPSLVFRRVGRCSRAPR